jgi:hypothetical protein
MKNSKDSLSHPLDIAELETAPAMARSASLSRRANTTHPHWPVREIETWQWTSQDCRLGRQARPDIAEDHEMTLLRIADLGREVLRRNMEWVHLRTRT